MTEAIPPGTCYHISAFYFTGCGLQRRPALLPRDRQSAPESAIPAFIPESDTPFWGRCQQERREKDRYRGGG
ncbi:hypothetical protein CE500_19195 [Salmonella enterica subsp. enterica serovar Typhimurium]|nr:hypothetical protein CE500_19195 [Salmonella enterica subsp. enterica serovar Typhimurium]